MSVTSQQQAPSRPATPPLPISPATKEPKPTPSPRFSEIFEKLATRVGFSQSLRQSNNCGLGHPPRGLHPPTSLPAHAPRLKAPKRHRGRIVTQRVQPPASGFNYRLQPPLSSYRRRRAALAPLRQSSLLPSPLARSNSQPRNQILLPVPGRYGAGRITAKIAIMTSIVSNFPPPHALYSNCLTIGPQLVQTRESHPDFTLSRAPPTFCSHPPQTPFSALDHLPALHRFTALPAHRPAHIYPHFMYFLNVSLPSGVPLNPPRLPKPAAWNGTIS